MSLIRWGIAGVMACSLHLAACGGDDKKSSDDDTGNEEGEDVGPSTGALCDNTLTYDHDVAPFMTKYCVSCHDSKLPAAQRQGAPNDHNFDSKDGVLAATKHIDEEAGAGPAGAMQVVNTKMPPLPTLPTPTTQERMTLSAWIACQPLK